MPERIINTKKIERITIAEGLPFSPKRIYWICTRGQNRGGHAHYENKQIITCIKGHFDFMVDNGSEIKKYRLSETQTRAIYITDEWHIMENCSRDCIILALASDEFNEADYMCDYKGWKKWKLAKSGK